MKFFKRPFVAAVLSAVIVLCSTLVSINVKLDDKCGDISNIFYTGTLDYPAMAAPIKELCTMSDDIILIANNYGIDTRELSQRLDDLELGIKYSDDDVGYIGSCYGDFLRELRNVENQLQATGLSERHTTAMADYSQRIEECSALVSQGAAGYNEAVRKFLRSYDKFPTSMWADLTGSYFPGYFSN